MIASDAKRCKRLYDMRSIIGRGRIDRFAIIAERDLCKQGLVVVFVERPPAAAPALHANQPVHAKLDCVLDTVRLPLWIFAEWRQRNESHCGIVGVWIKIIRILKTPTSRLDVGQLD